MRMQFEIWLKNYKEYKNTKVSNILKRIDKVSDDAVQNQTIESGLFHCKSFIEYAKKRSSVVKSQSLNPSEKNALDLLGDFFQVFDYRKTNYQIDIATELLSYCNNIKILYSYKPVFIWAMLELKAYDAPCPLDEICQRMIHFYSSRLENNLVAERSDSIFSMFSYDYKKAKQVIKSNPLAVLQKDRVVYYDDESQRVGFTSRYCPNENEVSAIKQICVEKVKNYYKDITSNVRNNHYASNNADVCVRIIKAIDDIESIIATTNDPNKLKASKECIYNLRQIWDNSMASDYTPESIDSIIEKPPKGKTEEISLPKLEIIKETDSRKIGKLVRESMTNLEICGFRFDNQLLEEMQNLVWSKTTMKLYYPFLKKYDSTRRLDEQIKDEKGNGRFWKQIFSFSGKKYLITSEWYKESKPLFIKWYNNLVFGENIENNPNLEKEPKQEIQSLEENSTNHLPTKNSHVIYTTHVNLIGAVEGRYYLVSYVGKLRKVSKGSTTQYFMPVINLKNEEKLLPVSISNIPQILFIMNDSFQRYKDIILGMSNLEIRRTYFK